MAAIVGVGACAPRDPQLDRRWADLVTNCAAPTENRTFLIIAMAEKANWREVPVEEPGLPASAAWVAYSTSPGAPPTRRMTKATTLLDRAFNVPSRQMAFLRVQHRRFEPNQPTTEAHAAAVPAKVLRTCLLMASSTDWRPTAELALTLPERFRAMGLPDEAVRYEVEVIEDSLTVMVGDRAAGAEQTIFSFIGKASGLRPVSGWDPPRPVFLSDGGPDQLPGQPGAIVMTKSAFVASAPQEGLLIVEGPPVTGRSDPNQGPRPSGTAAARDLPQWVLPKMRKEQQAPSGT